MLDMQMEGLPSGLHSDLSKLLAGLLDQASRAVNDDPEAASDWIRRAVSLLGEKDQEFLPGPAGPHAIGGLAPWQMRRIRDHVESQLATRLSNSSLAEIVRLSTSHLGRAFKISFGSSPHAYIIERRIERTKQLMLATQLPLVEISMSCGFADQAHFCHIFRRSAGVSPAVWRRTHLSLLKMRLV